jgi:hypothetical protein
MKLLKYLLLPVTVFLVSCGVSDEERAKEQLNLENEVSKVVSDWEKSQLPDTTIIPDSL